jgi:polyhydroxybutyrate depolymerase
MIKSRKLLVVSLIALAVLGSAGKSSAVEGTQNRPYRIVLPDTQKVIASYPVIIYLHGYTSSSAAVEKFMGLTGAAKAKGFISIFPEGTIDAWGATFWNATPACCNFFDSTVNDSDYLRNLIDEISAKYPIDKRRIYLAGHSNGGFMAHRMACEHSDQIAGIVSVAGAIFNDVKDCKATEPVSVLQVHGVQDPVITYESGNLNGQQYPSANQTAKSWAKINGCKIGPIKSKNNLGIERSSKNLETSVLSFSKCKSGASVQLWSMSGVGHTPKFNETFSQKALQFLIDHPKKLN